MTELLLTAEPRIDWINDITLPMLKWCAIIAVICIITAVIYSINEKVHGRPVRDTKGKTGERLVGLATFIVMMKGILTIMFFPFFIILAGMKKK